MFFHTTLPSFLLCVKCCRNYWEHVHPRENSSECSQVGTSCQVAKLTSYDTETCQMKVNFWLMVRNFYMYYIVGVSFPLLFLVKYSTDHHVNMLFQQSSY